jgi:phospholipase C
MASLNQIKHIVVLMLENRSFDNMLGWLYCPQNTPPFNSSPSSGSFEGVCGKNYSNPSVAGPSVPVGKGTDPTAPSPDPGEPYQDVYAQVYGQKNVLPLGQVPAEPTTAPNMQGFLYNYTLQCAGKKTNPNIIMNGFTSQTLPVLWSLGFYYGICDHWHASIPTQTLCNRSYLHAGTSSGYVNNEGGDGFLFANKTRTIFNVLSEAKKSWQIYTASWKITSLVFLTQDKAVEEGFFEHWSYLDDFFDAAKKKNGLPEYSFIEPIYIDSLFWGAENDMHPEAWPVHFEGLSNVEQGEKLLYKVYNAVRNSPDWDSTMLLILFDEHGGTYDHFSPPTAKTCSFAISPDDVVIPPAQSGGSGFNFDRLGVRVPAIVVSPYTAQQSVFNTTFDHTSALSTIVNCFDLPKGQLGKRQALAPDISAALNLQNARTDFPPIAKPKTWDESLGMKLATPVEALLHARNKPLNDLQKAILRGVARRLGKLPVDALADAANIQTALDADAYLMKAEAELVVKKL